MIQIQIYGKNNKLGIKYSDGYLIYRPADWKIWKYEVDELNKMLIDESETLRQIIDQKDAKQPEFFSGREIKRETALDKFKRRMAKYNDKNGPEEQNAGGPQMN